MIKLYSRQSDCARHARKNENADTSNFTSQIASLICTVIDTKRVKPDATIFKSRCSRRAVCYRLYRVEALPLSFVRFLRLASDSSKFQRSPARRSRSVREPSHKKSGEMSRVISGNVLAMARQWQQQCRRASVKTTRKTTCLAPDLDAQCPRRKLARQLAIRPRNGHATTNATSHKQFVGFLAVSFNQDIQKL